MFSLLSAAAKCTYTNFLPS